MSTDLIIVELKIDQEHRHIYKGGDECVAENCADLGIKCVAERKGRGDEAWLAFPCGLSMTQALVQELDQGAINQMNRVHIRHHEMGHEQSSWHIAATTTRDQESREITQVHMTCSDMEG